MLLNFYQNPRHPKLLPKDSWLFDLNGVWSPLTSKHQAISSHVSVVNLRTSSFFFYSEDLRLHVKLEQYEKTYIPCSIHSPI